MIVMLLRSLRQARYLLLGGFTLLCGFQLILVFMIFSAVFGLLVQAATVTQFAATVGLLAVTGTFFFFMVKAMARIQMPERVPRE